jgi:dTDP-4-amino-4,6-dideoxygalactose transaminase
MNTLAVLGAPPTFAGGIPFVRPAVPSLDGVIDRLRPSYNAGMLTNSSLVRELEELTAERLQVRHVIAVASCTSGLMLAVQALAAGVPVVLPSFTFSASAHALAWNASRPVFAECRPATMQVDIEDAMARMEGVGGIMATHVFGAPCEAERVEELGRRIGVPVLFDAAHAFGSKRQGRPIGGFGSAEVFSLSPTKPMVGGEGGLVATNDDALAEAVRIGRDYGNPGDYDTQFAGLNARMSEMHAAIALQSFADLDVNIAHRVRVARQYQQGLGDVPGVILQTLPDGDESTWKDFTVRVDAEQFGLTRDELVRSLAREGVDTRTYFSPPVHRQKAYSDLEPVDLPVTDLVSSQVVSLPIYPSLSDATVASICDVVHRLHQAAPQVREALGDA